MFLNKITKEFHCTIQGELTDYIELTNEQHNELFDAIRNHNKQIRIDEFDNIFLEDKETEPLTLEQLYQLKLNEIANSRFIYETNGLYVNDINIKTDRESQAQLASALQSLSEGFVESIRWKAANGWVDLTLNDVKPLAGLVAQHVQKAFMKEAELVEILENAFNTNDIDVLTNTHWINPE